MINYQNYIDKKRRQLQAICMIKWEYLKYSHISEWLDHNFPNDIKGQYYAIKILLNTIYYSKEDIETLLRFGLYDRIYSEIIKKELVENSNIYIPNSVAEAKILDLRNSSFFMPLLDSDKPYESGNSIISDLVHKLSIPANQVDFPRNVTEGILKQYKLLIFVDDCIGSGDQLKEFWDSDNDKIKHIKEICTKYNIKIYYLVLVGYDKYLNDLIDAKELVGIDIVVCDVLTDKNRVFTDESSIWESKQEKQDALDYFTQLSKKKGISVFGHRDLDFAVILSNRLPDWTLPIFWQEMPGWKCLMRRKST